MNKISVGVLALILSLVAYLVLQRIATNPKAPLFPLIIPTPVTKPASPSATPRRPQKANPTPRPTSTPKPLSFSESNQLYGPCVHRPVLMYHHVQSPESAKANGQVSLTVNTTIFQSHLEYLQSHHYNSITPQQLANFFDQGSPLPSNPVLLTFDDAYSDFSTDAAPLLQRFGIKATMFVPTGLVDNHFYLSWSDVKNLANTGLFTFANHTWSHHTMSDSLSVIQKEVTTAQTQLTDHGLSTQFFAYPYGTIGKNAVSYLASNNFSLAFTTKFGSLECKKQRLTLPRLRIGNAPLSSYGV